MQNPLGLHRSTLLSLSVHSPCLFQTQLQHLSAIKSEVHICASLIGGEEMEVFSTL